jgi:hypothetical protein
MRQCRSSQQLGVPTVEILGARDNTTEPYSSTVVFCSLPTSLLFIHTGQQIYPTHFSSTNTVYWAIVSKAVDGASGISGNSLDRSLHTSTGPVRNDKVTGPWAEVAWEQLGLASCNSLRVATAGGTIALGERSVQISVSYLLVLEGSHGAVVTLEAGMVSTNPNLGIDIESIGLQPN